MMNYSFNLTKEQDEYLSHQAARNQLSRAAMMREILDERMARHAKRRQR